MNNEESVFKKIIMEFITATNLDKVMKIMIKILEKIIDIFKN